MEKGNNEI